MDDIHRVDDWGDEDYECDLLDPSILILFSAAMTDQELLTLTLNTQASNYEEGCCMRQAFETPGTSLKADKAQPKANKKKISLTLEKDLGDRPISLGSKSRQSLTPILQPEYPRSSSLYKMASRSDLKKSRQEPTITNPTTRQDSAILTRAPSIKNSLLVFPPPQTQIIYQWPQRVITQMVPNFGAMKTSHIFVDPLSIARPSSLVKVSYDSHPKPQSKQKRGLNKLEYKSVYSTKESQNGNHSFINSLADSTRESFRIPNSQSDRKGDFTPEKAVEMGKFKVPLLLSSVGEMGDGGELDNMSCVEFRIPVANSGIMLNPEDLRSGKPYCKADSRDSKDRNRRTITFAEQNAIDYTTEQRKKASLLGVSRRISNFETYFKRGGIIGSGRVSSAYRVEENKTKQLLVSKEVYKKLVEQMDDSFQINKEIRNHYSLPCHPNIITLYGALEDSNRYYFIQEMTEHSLRHVIREGLTESTALLYISHILQGLYVLHQHQIIHKHLKPENVLVALGVCKISDFGWTTKLLEQNGYIPNLEYSSPEAVNGEAIDHKTDCWSAGVIAYEMVTGQLPPSNVLDSDGKWLNNVQRLSAKFQNLLRGLLEPNRALRMGVSEALQLMDLPEESLRLEMMGDLLS